MTQPAGYLNRPLRVLCVAGARPNFMKVAPLLRAFHADPAFEPLLVHTGQHYDPAMSELFFHQLGLPKPDINLGVGSGSHAAQTADIMKRFEPALLERRPDVVLVVGDVNSTIACGLVAAKLGIRLVHVEAGLRSFDRSMPEEINRALTDAISDLLFCTEASGMENLRREGVPAGRMHLVGNVMIDTLLAMRDRAEESPILSTLGLVSQAYAVVTLHRPVNVDDPAALARLGTVLNRVAERLPVVFPVHPRTRRNLGAGTLARGVRLLDPLGYLDFLKLLAHARLVLTDSGGIQEETTILRIPCLTLRANTERPVTTTVGTNRVVGADPETILAAAHDALDGRWPAGGVPPLWDGQAAQRIAQIIRAQPPDWLLTG